MNRELIVARIKEWKNREVYTLGEWLMLDISREEYQLRKAIEKDQLLAAKEDAKDAGVWV